MEKKTIVVVGAGKGLGNHVGKVFGGHGFRVVLVSRNIGKLNQYKQEFESDGIETHVYAADAEKPESLISVFGQIQQAYGTVDVLVYNAAVLESGMPASLDNGDFMRHLQVDAASALLCAKQVIARQAVRKEGVILLTGGVFGDRPVSGYAGISVGKAALKALGRTLHDELKEKGIFVGLVTVTDVIKPGTSHSPERIAEKYLEMYRKRDTYEYVY